MTAENKWTSRESAYDVIYQYPGAFGITQFTWSPGLWYIITRTTVNGEIMYKMHGSACTIEIDPDDLQAMRCFDALYAQMSGTQSTDPSQYIKFSDLSPIPIV